MHQSSARDDAAARREAAQAQLVEQRRATARAGAALAGDRADLASAMDQVEPITASLHEFSDLVARHVDTVVEGHAIARRLPASVDEYNAAVDRANELMAEIEAKAQVIEQQLDALRSEAEAQLAVLSAHVVR